MASNVVRTCDWCYTLIDEDNPIIAKLFLSPVVRGRTRTDHGSYSASMDIGQCCSEKVIKGHHWSKRQVRKDYNNGRKLRAGTSVEARSSRPTREAQ